MSDAHDPDPQTRGRETPAPRPPSRRSELVRPLRPSEERPDEAVCNAVFRYQLQQPLADAPQPPRYYVARQGRDPDDALLGRLRALVPAVQPLSQCWDPAPDGGAGEGFGSYAAV